MPLSSCSLQNQSLVLHTLRQQKRNTDSGMLEANFCDQKLHMRVMIFVAIHQFPDISERTNVIRNKPNLWDGKQFDKDQLNQTSMVTNLSPSLHTAITEFYQFELLFVTDYRRNSILLSNVLTNMASSLERRNPDIRGNLTEYRVF